MLNGIEKGAFHKLFNRGGYVLDFRQMNLMCLLQKVLAFRFARNIKCPKESRCLHIVKKPLMRK